VFGEVVNQVLRERLVEARTRRLSAQICHRMPRNCPPIPTLLFTRTAPVLSCDEGQLVWLSGGGREARASAHAQSYHSNIAVHNKNEFVKRNIRSMRR
jgi:hypothetical protein